MGTLPVRNRYRNRFAFLRRQGALELEKICLVESIKRPEDVVAGLGFELAAPDRSELVVHQQAPKFRRCLCRVADRGDEEILEFLTVSAVKAEAGNLRSRVQCGCGRCAWRGICS